MRQDFRNFVFWKSSLMLKHLGFGAAGIIFLALVAADLAPKAEKEEVVEVQREKVSNNSPKPCRDLSHRPCRQLMPIA